MFNDNDNHENLTVPNVNGVKLFLVIRFFF